MKIIKTDIPGLLIIEPVLFEDKRGYFYESYNNEKFQQDGIHHVFVQDNESKSTYGVIRGLHMQAAPYSQAKLIRVLKGSIYDVAVDVRKNSPTFGQWFGVELTEKNHLQLLVPRGLCHGFSVLSETATVFYKCDELYHPESETGIRYNDPELNIDWKIPEDSRQLSLKDKKLPLLKNFVNI